MRIIDQGVPQCTLSLFMNLHDFIFSHQRRYRFCRHLMFWLAWCFFWLTTYLIPAYWIPGWNLRGPMPQIEQYGFFVSFLRIMMNTSLMTIIYMALAYGILYFILPRYLSKNQHWISTTIILLSFIGALSFVNYYFFVLVFSISTQLGYFKKMPDMNFIVPIWSRQILFNYPTVVGFALAVKLLKNWYVKQKEAAEVANQKINAELQLLKAQVHPHFLFNTLNNIYSFIINNSPAAPQAIKKLSALLRYIVYECNQPNVKLEKELKMIRDYIDLESIRYGQGFNISLHIQGNAADKMISPLLLVPFLENSFKHGTSQMLTHPWINLNILVEEHDLKFELSNSKPTSTNENSITRGLGLRNVKKRLAILYPGNYSLIIGEDVMSFNVSLRVPISDSKEKSEQVVNETAAYELV
jgi:sensor histidine kinase YesM